jgi:hypothetical protein
VWKSIDTPAGKRGFVYTLQKKKSLIVEIQQIINFSKKLRLLSYIIEAAYGIITAIKPALGKWRG